METATARKRARQSEKEILNHEFLTIAEVALLLRVTQRTVYNLIYSGSLRATKITARITIIPKEDFMNMIRINDYNRTNGLTQPQGKEIHFPSVVDTIGSEPDIEDKGKEKKPRKPSKPCPRETPLKPSSDFKRSVKDELLAWIKAGGKADIDFRNDDNRDAYDRHLLKLRESKRRKPGSQR